jgi:DNA-binding response OmpR family regulator
VGSLGGYSILVVDDEPFVATSVTEALSDAGADVVTAHDLRTALDAAVNGNVSAAILDVTLGGADSGAVCTALKSRQVPFMFLTGYDTHDLLREWASVPALGKPAGEAELIANVEALLNPDGVLRQSGEPTSPASRKQRIVCCSRPRCYSTFTVWAVPPPPPCRLDGP